MQRWSALTFFSTPWRSGHESLRPRWHVACEGCPVLFRLCISVLLVVALSPAWGGGKPRTTAEIPFQFREGLIWVQVKVSKSDEPLNFLLDTGAGVSVIDSRTMTRLGLKAGHRVMVRGV